LPGLRLKRPLERAAPALPAAKYFGFPKDLDAQHVVCFWLICIHMWLF
jgi:hypothetical protein